MEPWYVVAGGAAWEEGTICHRTCGVVQPGECEESELSNPFLYCVVAVSYD